MVPVMSTSSAWPPTPRTSTSSPSGTPTTLMRPSSASTPWPTGPSTSSSSSSATRPSSSSPTRESSKAPKTLPPSPTPSTGPRRVPLPPSRTRDHADLAGLSPPPAPLREDTRSRPEPSIASPSSSSLTAPPRTTAARAASWTSLSSISSRALLIPRASTPTSEETRSARSPATMRESPRSLTSLTSSPRAPLLLPLQSLRAPCPSPSMPVDCSCTSEVSSSTSAARDWTTVSCSWDTEPTRRPTTGS
mmetsp:Transcript_16491/g.25461  ORF Transcript_16491/g.25461 Transcript_16491/m.25461 type:complete len:248 (-) Transcript_16491:170-913(-)